MTGGRDTGGLIPLLIEEQDHAYALYRSGMMAGLARIACWDEAVQRQRFARSLQEASLFWYQQGGCNLALLSMSRDSSGLTVHLLVVPQAARRKGSGRQAMQQVHALCPGGRSVRLSCLRHDRAVQAFYAALGYRIIHAGTDYLDLAWQAPA